MSEVTKIGLEQIRDNMPVNEKGDGLSMDAIIGSGGSGLLEAYRPPSQVHILDKQQAAFCAREWQESFRSTMHDHKFIS